TAPLSSHLRTLSLHDALPILEESSSEAVPLEDADTDLESSDFDLALTEEEVAAEEESGSQVVALEDEDADEGAATVAKKRQRQADRKSTRLNSSHVSISYAVV